VKTAAETSARFADTSANGLFAISIPNYSGAFRGLWVDFCGVLYRLCIDPCNGSRDALVGGALDMQDENF
jgi:hypothetical protein